MVSDQITVQLPDLVLHSDYGGNLALYEKALYELFCQDFIYKHPVFLGKEVKLKQQPMVTNRWINNRDSTYWHIISTEIKPGLREWDFNRSARVKWPKAIITADPGNNLLCWTNKRGSDKRCLVALPDFSYVVILGERSNYYVLISAYCVDRAHTLEKLRNDYKCQRKISL